MDINTSYIAVQPDTGGHTAVAIPAVLYGGGGVSISTASCNTLQVAITQLNEELIS